MSRTQKSLFALVLGLATYALGACAAGPDLPAQAADEDDQALATSDEALIRCEGSSARICNPEPRPATNLTILAPTAGAWGMYYFTLRGRWDDGRSTGGRTSSLVWTLSFDRDGAGPQPVTRVTMATASFSGTYTIPGDLVPINDCWPTPGTVTLSGVNAAGVSVRSSVAVDLYNGACWLN
jgi:hypothetical protein